MANVSVLARAVGISTVLLVQSHAQLSSSTPGSVRFQFREPRRAAYSVATPPAGATLKKSSSSPEWVNAWPENGSTNVVQFSKRVVLQMAQGQDLAAVMLGRPLAVARILSDRMFILQAVDNWTALREAESLSKDARVLACYPVTRRARQFSSAYAVRPNDPLFSKPDAPPSEWQAHLEYRDTNGLPLGLDLNVRAAWPFSTGENVVVAIADNGFETDHPDLIARTENAPHFNFITSESDGMPSGTFSFHATAVAGLVGATGNNGRGGSGVAPKTRLASWVIFGPNDLLVSDEALMDMFQYRSNIVSVQNHSWGKVGNDLLRLSTLEDFAISNAVTFGRAGRGAVIVRAAGNGREDGNDANEDGYLADPRVIAVAAARLDGRPARYSAAGACVLVAAPSGDQSGVDDACFSNSPNIVTTDRQGQNGYNRDSSDDGAGDYVSGSTGFSGTSAATPQISGVAALILGANTNLTYRDVQQILALSSRHYNLADPSLVTNGAGFRISHNLGFGVPDAGLAVELARNWPNRPAAITLTYTATNVAAIPDLGLRVRVEGPDVPDDLRSIVALPGGGLHPEKSMDLLSLVDVGGATSTITNDLRGKAALIARDGVTFFCQKLALVAEAGAGLAIVANNRGGNARILMVETDLSPIPALFIGQTDGDNLRAYLAATPQARAGWDLHGTNYTFNVSETLACEFVGLRVDTDHTARGDLRIVLTSPSGTRSIMQRVNQDTFSGPHDWTYYSVQHFYESSFGVWTISVSDEDNRGTGSVRQLSLLISGVPLRDEDHDGLDDAWELKHFGSLNEGPASDPDHDGYSNAREQVMGSDPAQSNLPLHLNLSVWDGRLARLSWPGGTNTLYRLEAGAESTAPLNLLTNVPGVFPETECFVPYTEGLYRFFRVEALPASR